METAIKPEKDTYVFQRARLTRICNELAPGKLVEFYEGSSWIKFRVRDDVLGVNLAEIRKPLKFSFNVLINAQLLLK